MSFLQRVKPLVFAFLVAFVLISSVTAVLLYIFKYGKLTIPDEKNLMNVRPGDRNLPNFLPDDLPP